MHPPGQRQPVPILMIWEELWRSEPALILGVALRRLEPALMLGEELWRSERALMLGMALWLLEPALTPGVGPG
jgi:hypothetical protein